MAHTGIHSALLCSYQFCNDSILQAFSVPNSFNSVTVSYWVYGINRSLFGCQDIFRSWLRASSGVTSYLQTTCASNFRSDWTNYTENVTSLVTPYRGQVGKIGFSGATTWGASRYYVDDVTVTFR